MTANLEPSHRREGTYGNRASKKKSKKCSGQRTVDDTLGSRGWILVARIPRTLNDVGALLI
jgi:hypothetical protein